MKQRLKGSCDLSHSPLATPWPRPQPQLLWASALPLDRVARKLFAPSMKWYFMKLFYNYSFIILTEIPWPNTWLLSGALYSYPKAQKGKQYGLLLMCHPLPSGWLGLLRWPPFHRQQVWKWIGCVMGERAKGLLTLSTPTPEELLEGLGVLSFHLQHERSF